MSLHIRLGVALIAATLLIGPGVGAADTHAHKEQPGAAGALHLNNGAKWHTDAPLRKGMDGINHDLAAALPRIHDGKLSADGYRKLAERMEGHIDYMVKNCRLAPEVDAQAHVVLEQVIEGAGQMQAGPDRSAGAVKIVQALGAYGRHFEHPGWAAPSH